MNYFEVMSIIFSIYNLCLLPTTLVTSLFLYNFIIIIIINIVIIIIMIIAIIIMANLKKKFCQLVEKFR